MNVCAYIGLGSNLEQPVEQIQRAAATLAQCDCVHALQLSPLYISRPMGPQDQPDFINAVAAITVSCNAIGLLDTLQAIETAHHRDRSGRHWGPRTLDLDILLFDDAHIDTPRLRVPHPGLAERAFVLYPLADIAPANLLLPGVGALTDALARVRRDGLRRLDDLSHSKDSTSP